MSQYFFAVMFFRVYFAVKAYYNFSEYKNHYSSNLCRSHQIDPSNWFVLKLYLTKKPVTTIMIISIYSVIMFATFILMFELEYFITTSLTSFYDPIFTSVYFVMITLSTIGYGDYSP